MSAGATNAELRTALIKAHAWILNDDADRFGEMGTRLWNALLDEIEATLAKQEPNQ